MGQRRLYCDEIIDIVLYPHRSQKQLINNHIV